MEGFHHSSLVRFLFRFSLLITYDGKGQEFLSMRYASTNCSLYVPHEGRFSLMFWWKIFISHLHGSFNHRKIQANCRVGLKADDNWLLKVCSMERWGNTLFLSSSSKIGIFECIYQCSSYTGDVKFWYRIIKSLSPFSDENSWRGFQDDTMFVRLPPNNSQSKPSWVPYEGSFLLQISGCRGRFVQYQFWQGWICRMICRFNLTMVFWEVISTHGGRGRMIKTQEIFKVWSQFLLYGELYQS